MILLRISCPIGGSVKKETLDFDDESTEFEVLLQNIADALGLESHPSTIRKAYELRTLNGGYAVRKTSQLKDEEELVLEQIVIDVDEIAKRNMKKRRRLQALREANLGVNPVKSEPMEEEEIEEPDNERKKSRRTDYSSTIKREEDGTEEESEDNEEVEAVHWQNQPENVVKREADAFEDANTEPAETHVSVEEASQFKEEDEEAQGNGQDLVARRPGSQGQATRMTSPQRAKRQAQPATVTPEKKRTKSRAEEGEDEGSNEEETAAAGGDDDDYGESYQTESEKEGQNIKTMKDAVNQNGAQPPAPARQAAARGTMLLSIKQHKYLQTARKNNMNRAEGKKTGTWSILKVLHEEEPGTRLNTLELRVKAAEYHGDGMLPHEHHLVHGEVYRGPGNSYIKKLEELKLVERVYPRGEERKTSRKHLFYLTSAGRQFCKKLFAKQPSVGSFFAKSKK